MRTHNQIQALEALRNSANVIPAIEQMVYQETLLLDANQVIKNKFETYDCKDRIADLKLLLCLLRDDLRP
jgi:hypothetical protein